MLAAAPTHLIPRPDGGLRKRRPSTAGPLAWSALCFNHAADGSPACDHRTYSSRHRTAAAGRFHADQSLPVPPFRSFTDYSLDFMAGEQVISRMSRICYWKLTIKTEA